MKTKNKQPLTHRLAVLALSLSLLFDTGAPRAVKAIELPFFKEQLAPVLQLPRSLPRQPRRAVTVVATAYSSTPDQTDDTPFITANGKQVYDGLIAANWLSLGTRVRIPDLFGDKILTVDDRMNERYGYGRIDIWFDAPREALLEFGAKRAKMEIF